VSHFEGMQKNVMPNGGMNVGNIIGYDTAIKIIYTKEDERIMKHEAYLKNMLSIEEIEMAYRLAENGVCEMLLKAVNSKRTAKGVMHYDLAL
jgi:hypothetical protein